MVNEIQEGKWEYLLDPCFELSNSAGKPLTNGWIEVYIAGSRDKYYCASDFSGTLHPFQIPLDSLGANIVLASPDNAYDVYVYNQYGSLIMSRYNVKCQTGSGSSTYVGDKLYYGQFKATDVATQAGLTRVTGNIDVDNGKLELKQGMSYHITLRGEFVVNDISNVDTVLSYIEYSVVKPINVNVDYTKDGSQYFEISYDIYRLAEDMDYPVSFLQSNGLVKNLVVEVHSLSNLATSGAGEGSEYEPGWGIVIQNNVISVDPSILNDYATHEEVIAAVSGVTGLTPGSEYTAGSGINIVNNEISVDTTVIAMASGLPTTDLGKFTIQNNVSGGPIEVICPTDVGMPVYTDIVNESAVSGIYISSTTTKMVVYNSPGFDDNYWNYTNGQITLSVPEEITGIYSLYAYYSNNTAPLSNAPYFISNYTVPDTANYKLPVGNYTINTQPNQASQGYGKYLTFILAGPNPDIDAFAKVTVKGLERNPALGISVDLDRYYLGNTSTTTSNSGTQALVYTDPTTKKQTVFMPNSMPTNWKPDIIQSFQYGSNYNNPTYFGYDTRQYRAYKLTSSGNRIQFAYCTDWDSAHSKMTFISHDDSGNAIEKWTLDYSSYYSNVWTTTPISDSYTAGSGIDITNNVISVDNTAYIPYSASGVYLPNSKFEIDTEGQAYKVIIADSESNYNRTSDGGILFYYGVGTQLGTYKFILPSNVDHISISNGQGNDVTGTYDVSTHTATINVNALGTNATYVYAYDSNNSIVILSGNNITGKYIVPGVKEEYITDGDIELNDNNQVTAIDGHTLAGTGGSDYNEGFGIDISNGEISIDTNIVALASAIPAAQVQADWDQADDTQVDYIKNKPDLSVYATHDELAGVTGILQQEIDNIDLSDYSTHTEVYNATVTAVQVATAAIPEMPEEEEVEFEEINLDDYALASAIPDISNLASHIEVYEATVTAIDYVTGIIPEAQVQSDWNQNDSSKPDYIKNKPSIPSVEGLATVEQVSAVSGYLQNEINNIPGQVQSDWGQTDNTQVDFIKNKPTEYDLVAGHNVSISVSGTNVVISSTGGSGGGGTYTEGLGIDITNDVISLDNPVQLIAGDNVSISVSGVSAVISAQGGGSTYTAGLGIDITSNEIAIDPNVVALASTVPAIELNGDSQVTAIDGHALAAGGPTYTPGTGIDITNDVISVDNTVAMKTDIPELPEEEEVEFEELNLDDYALASAVPTVELDSNNQVTAIDGHALAGGSGDSYTEGFGIDISNNEISIDPSIVALASADPNIFFAHVKATDTNYSSTTEYTPYADVKAAYDAGKIIYCVLHTPLNWIYAVLPLVSASNMTAESSGYLTLTFTVYSPETWKSIYVVTYDGWMQTVQLRTYPCQADWNQAYSNYPGYIKNKPSIPEIELNSDSQVTAIDGHMLAGSGGGSTYTAGDYISIQNDVIAVTGIDPSLYAAQSDLEAVSGLITPELPVVAGEGIGITETETEITIAVTGNYVSDSDLQTAIQTVEAEIPVVTGFATKTELQAVSATIPEMPEEEEVEFETVDLSDYALASAVPDVSNLATKAELQTVTGLIPDTSDMATQTWVGQQGFLTSVPSNYVTETELTGAVSGFATKGELSTVESEIPVVTGFATKSELTTGLNGKQNTLTGITDVQVVNSLPGSPVATVLYLIPEV